MKNYNDSLPSTFHTFNTSHKIRFDFSSISLSLFHWIQEHPSIVFQSWLNQYWISMSCTTWSWLEVDLSMSSIKNYGKRSSKAFICHQVSRVQLSHWEHSKLKLIVEVCWEEIFSTQNTKKNMKKITFSPLTQNKHKLSSLSHVHNFFSHWILSAIQLFNRKKI